jgi:hypothetical protein
VSYWVAGGFPMVFVAVFGLVAIASSVRFALAPAPGGARAIVAYAAAVVFVSLAGTAFDLVAVARYVAREEPVGDQLTTILVVGGSEALSPVILGFSLVAVAMLATAVGLRRRPS